MLPDLDGLEVCRRLRGNGATVSIPIIMLTARTDEVDRIVGLEMGADDYVTKPFSPRELVARVMAVLRRTIPPLPRDVVTLTKGDLRLDPVRHEVTRGSQAVPLSTAEFRLLEFFLRHRDRVHTRQQLLEQLSERDHALEARTVDVHVRRLRKKVERDPRRPTLILTVRGVGYKCPNDAE
jgi:DNA-binding response OmpR family regulator